MLVEWCVFGSVYLWEHLLFDIRCQHLLTSLEERVNEIHAAQCVVGSKSIEEFKYRLLTRFLYIAICSLSFDDVECINEIFDLNKRLGACFKFLTKMLKVVYI